ncbi:MAG: hypothetical protein AAGU75_14705 [Bacillota bacterium]
MKFLNQFLKFDWASFAKDKRFLTVGIREWNNFETKEHLGTRVDTIICRDNTNYNVREGEIGSNIYEKITFKVPKDIDIPMNVEIQPNNVDAIVYGDHRNQLSVTAGDVVVMSKKEA